MSKRNNDNKPSVEELLSLLERGQMLLEQAQQTLRHAEQVRAEVSTQLAPPAPPPEPEPAAGARVPIRFPWPPASPAAEDRHTGGP